MVRTKQKRRQKVVNPTTTLSEVEVEKQAVRCVLPRSYKYLTSTAVANGDQYVNMKRVGVIAKATCSAWEKVEVGKAQIQYMYVAHKLVTDTNAE
jgi:hypothetical protein